MIMGAGPAGAADVEGAGLVDEADAADGVDDADGAGKNGESERRSNSPMELPIGVAGGCGDGAGATGFAAGDGGGAEVWLNFTIGVSGVNLDHPAPEKFGFGVATTGGIGGGGGGVATTFAAGDIFAAGTGTAGIITDPMSWMIFGPLSNLLNG